MTSFVPLPLDSRMDRANLSDYGKLIPLLDDFRPSIWEGAALIKSFKTALTEHDYDPASDYIVLTGKTIYVAVLMAALWEFMDEHFPNDSGVMFLVYDAGPGLYKETRLPRATVV